MVREVRDRERNTRFKADGIIIKEMTNLVKDLERDRYEAGTYGFAPAFAKAKVCRIDFNIDRLRWMSEGERPIRGLPSICMRPRQEG